MNINFLRVINDGNYCLICGATTDGCDCELGVYSTEEKALDVLDEIQELIEDKQFCKTYKEEFVDWAEECDFGYDQLPEEYEKYKTDLEEKGLDYCEGLRYIAIQEAKKALKVYENHVEMMDEKLDEWEQGERK